MDFSVLTYNTLFGNGQNALKKIFEKYKPDIVCLQEINTSKSSLKEVEKLGYTLADYSNAFIKFNQIYGVATFYNPHIFKVTFSNSISLPTGFFDILVYIVRIFKLGKKTRTVLESQFLHNKTENKVIITNVHFSPFGTNNIRLKQLRKTIKEIASYDNKPTIIAGDFNYAYGRKKLEECMYEFGFKEATNTIFSTVQGKISGQNFIEKLGSYIINKLFRDKWKMDYMFYKNCSVISSETLHSTFSDHLPILSRFKFDK